jgi:uncharacterized protein YehS (DUF1456 family)
MMSESKSVKMIFVGVFDLIFLYFKGIRVNNNYVLTSITTILEFDAAKLIAVFASVEQKLSKKAAKLWLENSDECEACTDEFLELFLNGLINELRGKKDGPLPALSDELSNNIILRKLTIAFDLKADNVIYLLARADQHLKTNELSAFFRKKGNSHFRPCNDDIITALIQGLAAKYKVRLK